MPYIGDVMRETLDPLVLELIERIKDMAPEGDRDGVANYVISRIVAASMRPKDGWRYKSLAHAAEVFTAAGDEFRRRMLDPYEDRAIAKNGDIPEYETPRAGNPFESVHTHCCPVHGCKYSYEHCPVAGSGGKCARHFGLCGGD